MCRARNIYGLMLGQERMWQALSPAPGSLDMDGQMGGWTDGRMVPDTLVMGWLTGAVPPPPGHGQAARGSLVHGTDRAKPHGWRCGGAVGHILRCACSPVGHILRCALPPALVTQRGSEFAGSQP